MKKILEILPELEGEESHYISRLIEPMTEEDRYLFAQVYRSRRRDPLMMLVLAMVGLFGVAGIHRFISGQIGMGILYVLTLGLCLVGTIVDMINYKSIAFEYNRNVAREIVTLINS